MISEEEFTLLTKNLSKDDKIKLADLIFKLEALKEERARLEIEVMELLNDTDS